MLIYLLILFTAMLQAQTYEELSCYASSNKKSELLELVEDATNLNNYLKSKISTNFDRRCDISGIENKKEYIIVFDGANTFAPVDFELNRLQMALMQKDVNNNIEKYAGKTGLKVDEQRDKEIYKKAVSPLRSLIQTYPELARSHQDFIYFSHTHLSRGARCIKKIKEHNPNVKVKLLAYSWGGNTAQKIMNKLNRQGVTIDSVFLMDPVRKGFAALGTLKNLTGVKNSKFFKKTSNVNKLYTVYQKTDDKSLRIASIRGNPAEGADKNINLSIKCSGADHLFFDSCDQTLEIYKLFLAD